MGYSSAAFFLGGTCGEASLFLAQVAKIFLPEHMGGGLVLGLIAIKVSVILSGSFRMCVVLAEAANISR